MARTVSQGARAFFESYPTGEGLDAWMSRLAGGCDPFTPAQFNGDAILLTFQFAVEKRAALELRAYREAGREVWLWADKFGNPRCACCGKRVCVRCTLYDSPGHKPVTHPDEVFAQHAKEAQEAAAAEDEEDLHREAR